MESETPGMRCLQQALLQAGRERTLDSHTRFPRRSYTETLTELETEAGKPPLASAISEWIDQCFMRLAKRRSIPRSHGH